MPLAVRNRETLSDAARDAFAKHGLEVPVDQIARGAAIRNATLYRRFPTRADLVAAVFQDQMADHVTAVEAALRHADSWAGLRSYVAATTALQATDRAIADLVTMDLSAAPEIEALRKRAFQGRVTLLERAKAVGALRSDCTPEDVLVLLIANAGVLERTGSSAEGASAPLTHLVLDGLRAEAATDGPKPLSRRRMRLVTRALSAWVRLCSERSDP